MMKAIVPLGDMTVNVIDAILISGIIGWLWSYIIVSYLGETAYKAVSFSRKILF